MDSKSDRSSVITDYKPSIKQKFTEKQVLAAINRCQGLTAPLMRALDCTYSQLVVYLQNHPKCKEAAERAREEIVATAEEKLLNLTRSDDQRIVLDACKFILSRLDAKRYGQQVATQTVVQNGDQKVSIQSIFGIPDE